MTLKHSLSLQVLRIWSIAFIFMVSSDFRFIGYALLIVADRDIKDFNLNVAWYVVINPDLGDPFKFFDAAHVKRVELAINGELNLKRKLRHTLAELGHLEPPQKRMCGRELFTDLFHTGIKKRE